MEHAADGAGCRSRFAGAVRWVRDNALTYILYSYAMHAATLYDDAIADKPGQNRIDAALRLLLMATIVWTLLVAAVDVFFARCLERFNPRLCDAPPPPARRLVALLLVNASLHAAFVLGYAVYVGRGLDVRRQVYAWTALETAACFALYELFFYALHRVLHLRLGAYHALHHETHANLGAANFYMHPVDFALEVVVPLWLSIGLVNPAYNATIGVVLIGVMNSVVSHSGVKFLGMPDPRDHWLHHHVPGCNYGTGPLDALLGTHRPTANVALECRVDQSV